MNTHCGQAINKLNAGNKTGNKEKENGAEVITGLNSRGKKYNKE